MRHVDLFEKIDEGQASESHIRLVRKDTGGKLELDAAFLIAQYQFSSGDFLLVLDEGCAYEEQLHLVLVRNVEIIDGIVIGAPYATGIYREVGIDNEKLYFSFLGDAVLTLSAREKASRMPQSLPPGVRRRGGLFVAHHLSLSAERAA